MANNIIKHLIIDVEKTIGNSLVLLGSRPLFSYMDGVKVGKEGLTCTCLSEIMGFEKVDIKITGLMELPFVFDGTPIAVEFEGLEGKVWQDWSNKGQVKLSISAKGIRQHNTEKRIKLGGNKE